MLAQFIQVPIMPPNDTAIFQEHRMNVVKTSDISIEEIQLFKLNLESSKSGYY